MAQVKLKGTPIHTSGELPKVGSKAPDFTLVDKDLKERHLKEFRGKKKLISIVPSLDTEVCSLSTKKFNELAKKRPDSAFLIISADTPFAQKRVCGAEHMTEVITLSMMPSKDFAKDYGVLIQDGPLKGICARAVLVLDENDRVIYEELVPEITQEPNYEAAFAYL